MSGRVTGGVMTHKHSFFRPFFSVMYLYCGEKVVSLLALMIFLSCRSLLLLLFTREGKAHRRNNHGWPN